MSNPISARPDYPITPVHSRKVSITDGFWQPRRETNRNKTIPYNLKKCEETGRIENFVRTSKKNGEPWTGGPPFNDSDVYKVLEAIALSLQVSPDPGLKALADSVIDKIATAQLEDGYINTFYSLVVAKKAEDPQNWMFRGDRWTYLSHSHELYCAGHLMEAAVAYYLATNEQKLLDVAISFADHIESVFGEDRQKNTPGHPEIEIGLIKLFRVTNDEKYLKLARFFIDERGSPGRKKDYGYLDEYFDQPGEMAQDHKPFLEQDRPVGHAVRAGYLYAGVADVAALTGDQTYILALKRIWESLVSKALYITGGIGCRHNAESFGKDYELPNATAYTETCAAIANIFWNHRMFLLLGDAKYLDIVERTLYNGFLAGVSMSGDAFFYPNPLESDGLFTFNKGTATRQPWFNCSCCPTNVARFFPDIGGYAYARRDRDLFINLFIAGNCRIEGQDFSVGITQETKYPWSGSVRIEVEPDISQRFALYIRIPGWSSGKPVASDLYSYLEKPSGKPAIKINGVQFQYQPTDGFAHIDREWEKGDLVEVELPMPVHRVISHPNITTNAGRVALERGPVVYCAEAIDNGGHALDIKLSDSTDLDVSVNQDLLGGVSTIVGKTSGGKDFMAIPYYAWSHRGVGEMAVWLKREEG